MKLSCYFKKEDVEIIYMVIGRINREREVEDVGNGGIVDRERFLR